jgi:hypothetical protein
LVNTVKTLALGVAVATAGIVFVPTAQAGMLAGNYEVQTDRDQGHSWLWNVRPCQVEAPDCAHINTVPRPNGQAYAWTGDAHLANGRYTMVVDVPDGVRCTVYFLPSHDTYSWDAATLTGSVNSTFDAGCGNSPGGTATYQFSLLRF